MHLLKNISEAEGSTRPIALMRIAIGLIVWARFGDEIAFFQAVHPLQAIFGGTVLVVSAAVVVGAYARLALFLLGACLFGGYIIMGAALQTPEWFAHHVYLLTTASFLLALTPCDRSYSLDRYRLVRSAERLGKAIPPERGNLWAQGLIGLQLSAVYFWAAYDKTNWAFLSGQRLEQTLVWTYSGRALEEWLMWPIFVVSSSVLVVVVEYILAVMIHARRWHYIVLPIGIGLHTAFYLFLPVKTYSITMVALYLALLDPDAVHRFIDRMQGYAHASNRI